MSRLAGIYCNLSAKFFDTILVNFYSLEVFLFSVSVFCNSNCTIGHF